MKIDSYVCGAWRGDGDKSVTLNSAVDGKELFTLNGLASGFDDVVEYGRQVGGVSLRQMTIHERANLLKKLAAHLMSKKEEFYRLSYFTGATRADSWIDIEGGIGTLFSYSSMARRALANERFIVEGDVEPLSAGGSFLGQHILTSKRGVSFHINAFNFPVWGMLEKIAPSLIAGVPVIVKPGTVTSYLTHAVVKEIIASGILPNGAIQLICGGVGDLFEHLDEQDSVTFTGSASTGKMLRSHPNITDKNIPFNMEADSLNACILAPDVRPDSPEFNAFVKEVHREMTTKAGQKCTAIRRIFVPRNLVETVSESLKQRLLRTPIGDPANDTVRMGALVGKAQRQDVLDSVEKLLGDCESLMSGWEGIDTSGFSTDKGAFMAPCLLYCDTPLTSQLVHEVEAFGPVSTLMPYDDFDQIGDLVARGRGSLVSSLFSYDQENIHRLVHEMAPYNGRILVNNRESMKESTGHGSPLPSLVHGGPGRAGGGEELGGLRAVKHYMQRTAVQGSPNALTSVTREYVAGADRRLDPVHPFKKYFEDLQVGDGLTTHRRTITEADIVNFGCLSGDHFYAHFDETSAADSLFGQRVAHGYFVISAAAGMFVEPSPGPVLANYGLDNLRFINPAGIGDTIQVELTVKRKVQKTPRPDDTHPAGVIVWDVKVTNQHYEVVALYEVLTLVAYRQSQV
ncbi:phenylacetic acid degradation bifunctional protein PaaZ [Shewanella corallii]|uniref:Phenylacetic acid degradation bifunctional protein PaaZ n=1 Tax=Shewanella corallii TaxID=560080 RepID=A0ABT0N4D2_9GAMM|nr:phenylacetic acid degradation bifunctional protein PaaZ [Shewanella corallii]MCL2913283.1 phenylacetic acid degradation bifunctional protein PaaZ [Shewanella corallii]